MAQFITEKEVGVLINDGDTVAVGGSGALASPELLLKAVEEQYEKTGHPSQIMVACLVGPADNSENDAGLNRLSKPGLVKGVIGAHLAFAKRLGKMIAQEEIEAYMLPLGSAVHLFRAMGSRKKNFITDIGLGTFADPRIEGCKINRKAKESGREIVSLAQINGKEYLAYNAFPVNVCLIRGTFADEDGNISMEEELIGDYSLQMAAAAKASGGKVIVQVKKIVKGKSLNPKLVRIHKSLVDYVVECADEKYHCHCLAEGVVESFFESFSLKDKKKAFMPLCNRKIIARRVVRLIKKGMVINLGIGIPSGVGIVAEEEGLSDFITSSLETGPVGGVPAEGLAFGISMNPDLIYPVDEMFDLYDGGLLDLTGLGAAEIDRYGNVNVSRFGSSCTGPGGFVNISQRTPVVCFMGTFTAGGLKEEVIDGRLVIVNEGKVKKFVNNVQQITYSGKYAARSGQDAYYITERAVFRLTPDGIMLTEIAPGIDLQKDVLDQMEFAPLISGDLKLMDESIFKEEPMGYINEFLKEK